MKELRNGELVTVSDEDAAGIAATQAAVPAPPRMIHPAWLRLALIEIDKLDAVNAAVAAQGPVKAALWEYATSIRENDADVNAIATALSIDLAAVFDQAEAIRDARQG